MGVFQGEICGIETDKMLVKRGTAEKVRAKSPGRTTLYKGRKGNTKRDEWPTGRGITEKERRGGKGKGPEPKEGKGILRQPKSEHLFTT